MNTELAPVDGDEVPVQEMVVIHRIFRREFPMLADLIRRCPDGDIRWAQSIGEHADFITTALHYHHTAEDEYLWPLLRQRAQPGAGLVQRMEQQHQAVTAHITRAEHLLVDWRQAPASALGNELATTVTSLSGSLIEHLDEEEARILPLVSDHVTPAEWGELGQLSFEKFPRSALPIMLGQMLESATAAEAELFLRKLPAFVPVLWQLAGRRRYDRYIRRVRGQDGPAVRWWMRRANKVHTAAYRLSVGRLGSSAKGIPVALLTVPGRKTGAPHTVPVACLEHDGTYLVAGTSGGTKAEPQWFRNIRVAQRVHVQIGAHGHDMNCRVADDDERNRLWRDVILARHPFFAKYQERSGRIIPVAVLWH